jgi:excisionase family DNA binding protein
MLSIAQCFCGSLRSGAVPRSMIMIPTDKRGPMPPWRESERIVEKLLLTVPEAAERLGIGRAKAWELVRTGRLPSLKIDWSRRVTVDAVDEFIDRLAAEQASSA